MSIIKILETFNKSAYLSWKRKNVTIRGMKDTQSENNAGAMLGRGLYTAFLSNKTLAKQYGTVYFVVGAIPKKPKVFNTLNEWEIWFYGNLVQPLFKNGEFPDARVFHSKTTIEAEMIKKGHDGIIIKGREMVNFTPNMDEIRYYQNENQLIQHYEYIIENK